MKKILIELLVITTIIVITRLISDTYISGEIAGILGTFAHAIINGLEKK